MLCMGCKGDFEVMDGPVHEYMESTPGCWAAYSKVLAIQYQSYSILSDIHRLTADTYAVNHPGQPSRVTKQSVWGHLVGVHFYLERGFDGEKTRRQLGKLVESVPELPWLQPPDFTGALNVGHVLGAVDVQDHIKRVKEWGRSVYSRWQQSYASEIERMARRIL